MWHPGKSIKTVLFLCLLIVAAPAFAKQVAEDARWSGEVILSESVQVMPKATLVIAAGTRVVLKNPAAKISVRGRIMIEGTEQSPVIFSGVEGWEGIEFMEALPGSLIRWAHVTSAKAAISSFATDFRVESCTFTNNEFGVKLLRESSPVIVDSLFDGNQIGVDNEMKSAPVIRNNRFVGHERTAVLASHNSRGEITGNRFEQNKQGVTLMQRYEDRITKNVFVGNDVGIYCNQTQNTPLIEDNRFEKNVTAVFNFSFAYPALKANLFTDNGMAVRNDQFGSPLVENNLFSGNETALYNYRKSNPKVHGNRFENNDLALFCDYSSYPVVKQNNFIGNKMAVKLGIYQSADWEKRAGSMTIVQREATARKSQNPLLGRAPTEFRDVVDVSGNWWGEDNEELARIGEDGNASIFHDRRDQPRVTYEGFGPESYRLDRVQFSPWLDAPVAEAASGGNE